MAETFAEVPDGHPNLAGVVLISDKTRPAARQCLQRFNNYRIHRQGHRLCNMADPVQQVSKSFEIDVTCP